jgi:hypothetical protein
MGFPASEAPDVLTMIQALSSEGVNDRGELSLLVPLDKTIRNGFLGLPGWAMPGADLDESKENLVPIGLFQLDYQIGRRYAKFVFTSDSREIGALLWGSVSMMAMFVRMLEENRGLFGLFSVDEGKGQMFWCLGRRNDESVLYMPQDREPDELADRILIGRTSAAGRSSRT